MKMISQLSVIAAFFFLSFSSLALSGNMIDKEIGLEDCVDTPEYKTTESTYYVSSIKGPTSDEKGSITISKKTIVDGEVVYTPFETLSCEQELILPSKKGNLYVKLLSVHVTERIGLVKIRIIESW